jgi:hypothetical protein
MKLGGAFERQAPEEPTASITKDRDDEWREREEDLEGAEHQ